MYPQDPLSCVCSFLWKKLAHPSYFVFVFLEKKRAVKIRVVRSCVVLQKISDFSPCIRNLTFVISKPGAIRAGFCRAWSAVSFWSECQDPRRSRLFCQENRALKGFLADARSALRAEFVNLRHVTLVVLHCGLKRVSVVRVCG